MVWIKSNHRTARLSDSQDLTNQQQRVVTTPSVRFFFGSPNFVIDVLYLLCDYGSIRNSVAMTDKKRPYYGRDEACFALFGGSPTRKSFDEVSMGDS